MTPERNESSIGPKISVVIPTHFRTDSLLRLIESLREQSFSPDHFEVIVVPTPNDPSITLLEHEATKCLFSLRCRLDQNDDSNGRSAAAKRNFGARCAQYDWIAFIDDDCIADSKWLENASTAFATPNVVAVEGRKVIPPPQRPTFTYKGLRRFEHSGGYQTCNMFYNRRTFFELGGFDLSFPYYLEDSDLAWSVLDSGCAIAYVADAVVNHPVPAPAPWKLLDDAKRVHLLPLLRSKHSKEYRRSGIRALRPIQWSYIVLQIGIVLALLLRMPPTAAMLCVTMLMLVCVHLLKIFWGCRVERSEFCVTAVLLPLLPVIRLIQLIRGNVLYRTWLWT